ncbi:MAG: DNA glycosylase [Thermoplasmata archaeon]
MKFSLDVWPLDLGMTLGCGQTFRWRVDGDGHWMGVIDDQFVRLARRGRELSAEVLPGRRDAPELVARYLRTDDDIGKIHRVLARDEVLARGLQRFKGLRLVKMDEWECLASYVLATYANIPRIAGMIERISLALGEEISPGIHAFPRRERVAKAGSQKLKKLGLGYRAHYLSELSEGIDEARISRMRGLPYEQVREELIELPGVGDKVADCVALFGFGMLEAFPIDVWVERALARLYGKRGSYSELRRFAVSRFGRFAGYAQEYMYHNERLRARTGVCMFLERRGR